MNKKETEERRKGKEFRRGKNLLAPKEEKEYRKEGGGGETPRGKKERGGKIISIRPLNEQVLRKEGGEQGKGKGKERNLFLGDRGEERGGRRKTPLTIRREREGKAL